MAVSSSERWERYVPLGGVVFAVLMVLSAIAFPMPPGGDAAAAAHPSWLTTHHDAVIAQSYLRGMAAVALLVLIAALAAAVRRVRGSSVMADAVLVAGALEAGLLLLAQGVGLATALLARDGATADTVRALAPLQDACLDIAALPGVVVFGAAGLAAIRTKVLPRWLGVLSLVGAPVALTDALSYDGGPLASIGLLGLLYSIGWALLVGVRLPLQPVVDDNTLQLPDQDRTMGNQPSNGCGTGALVTDQA